MCTYDECIVYFNFSELLPESQFNVEQIVQCLRHSSNPHTQHSALLLLSTAAKIFPVMDEWIDGWMVVYIKQNDL